MNAPSIIILDVQNKENFKQLLIYLILSSQFFSGRKPSSEPEQ